MSNTSTSSTTPATNSAGVTELLNAGKALGAPIVNIAGIRPVVVVPEGYKLEPLPFAERAPLPDHVRQAVTLDDAESFVAYLKQWKRTETAVFVRLPVVGGDVAQAKSAQFRAIFDYHTRGDVSDAQVHAAARCAHTAIYPCPLSVEWQTWAAVSGKPQKQTEFIDFIEANGPDIVSPPGASLMELAINFSSKTDVMFQSKVDRLTGGCMLGFKEDVQAGGNGGQIKVPDAMSLRLPVFEGGKPFEIDARLQWLPRDGKLSIYIHLRRPVDVLRKAMADLRLEIETAAEIKVLTGTAEAPDNAVKS